MEKIDGRSRVLIEGVRPEVDAGRFAIKRTIGESVRVEADIFADGHDSIAAVLLYRKAEEAEWSEVPFQPLVNDRWEAGFVVTEPGRYLYSIRAWIDRFSTWRRDTGKKLAAGQDISVDLQAGLALVKEAAAVATGEDSKALERWRLRIEQAGGESQSALLLSDQLSLLMAGNLPRRHSTRYSLDLPVWVDRERARFSTWYEMFPRSCGPEGRHGTFRDCEERLDYISRLGFDVLYLPPIHPIGRAHRKGRNNARSAGPGDVGSPWAIGAPEGGHKSIHPELGSLQDFRRLVGKAAEVGVEIALDIAFQCSPDHPYVREHPEWFRHRPDGTIQYAENPPKKYEDIYPFDFESEDWPALWEELKSIFLFWIEQGVKIFRVDNPHTKSFAFWEWAIGEIKNEHPEVIFLSEAFTRPKVMYRLAKLGFTQSYTYFAWRNTKWELTRYFTEMTQTGVREFFRPNPWPNTPDILTQYLQTGGRAAFAVRLILAATLGASYGIYGPPFELAENQAREWGSEEYLDSEKYQIRRWDLSSPHSLRDLISRINRVRRENPALQSDWNLRFHTADNEQIICYSKHTDDLSNIIVTIVNLDPYHTQSGWVKLPAEDFGIESEKGYQAHDLLTGARYLFHGSRSYVELSPQGVPAHVFRLRRRLRTEHDFEYFM